ncbi:MAG: hypothetical protein HYZ74_04855 [Elusimicrobia bacterium]|nr:hypothetical protein [Elusimicrobiota bacterium]
MTASRRRLAAILLALPPLLVPLQNPDIFWHLSAGRWMAQNRAFPRLETFSFTFAGARWEDFEWLTQLLYYGMFSLLGMPGLWLLKVLLMAACAWISLRVVRLYGAGEPWEAAAAVAWTAGALTHSDARPDLMSVLGLSVLLWMLERRRVGAAAWGAWENAAVFTLFAVWSNCHAGFAFGLALLASYCLGALSANPGDGGKPGQLAGALAAAVAGTLCNPYGVGPYAVMLQHWGARAELARHIQEWQPISFRNGFHWPLWPILALGFALLLKLRRSRRLPLGLCAATLYFAYNAMRHARLASYLNVAVVPLIVCLARESGWLERPAAKRVLTVVGVVYAGYLAWVMAMTPWSGAFVGRYVPRGAAAFMAQEKDALAPLRVANPWEWGGYLGFVLPGHRVFSDGRYIFHPLLAATAEAAADAGKYQDLLARYGATAALARNTGARFASRKLYPGGATKVFLRPWYLASLPRERWALVYWDEQALLFVDRKAVPSRWLEEHDYRYVRPGDDAAFREAVALKEIPAERVRVEEERHRIELLRYRPR